MLRKIFHLFLITFISFFIFSSCSFKNKPVVIWTDHAEIVPYVELFNMNHEKTKAIIVYKNNIADAFPPLKDEVKPDLVIGSWLKTSKTKKLFSKINSLMGKNDINPENFYPGILEYGKIKNSQYLLPINFNLPAVLFSSKSEALVDANSMITTEQIQKIAESFNKKNEKDSYVSMGFGPTWNTAFIYEIAKLNSVNFTENGNFFSYDAEKLSQTIQDIKKWTETYNTSTKDEYDFSYKYLYVPANKQIETDRCLFAYATSDKFLNLSSEQIENIDFRWISKDGKIFAEDEIISMGIYKNASNKKGASTFIKWFFNENSQKAMLEKNSKMNLNKKTFGICNGFSSLRTVNERFFPSLYKNLFGNLPANDALVTPNELPARWSSLIERVIKPYLADAAKTVNQNENAPEIQSIEERLNIWAKQFN